MLELKTKKDDVNINSTIQEDTTDSINDIPLCFLVNFLAFII